MAEGYLNSLCLPNITAESRGFGYDGDPVSENSAAVMKEIGIDISAHRSRHITADNLNADRIICMTSAHKSALAAAGIDSTVLGGGISDPFGSGLEVYRKCRDEITSAVRQLAFGGFFTDFHIRTADINDAERIAAVEKSCFSSPWSENAIKESLQAGTHMFAAEGADGIVGYIGVNCVAGEGYITDIAVYENMRGKGVGSYLISYTVESAKAAGLEFLSLEVRVSNENAIRLYKKYGFVQEGRRKNFYTDPREDALILTKRF